MLKEVPLKERLEQELECRRIAELPEGGKLAAMLLRHTYSQEHRLKCAVKEIARLEGMLLGLRTDHR